MAPASVLGALRAQGRLRRALEGWRQLLEAGCDEAPSTDSLSTMPSSCAAWTASIVSHAASEASAPGNALKGLRRRRCRSLTALCVSVLGSQAARVSKLRAPCGGAGWAWRQEARGWACRQDHPGPAHGPSSRLCTCVQCVCSVRRCPARAAEGRGMVEAVLLVLVWGGCLRLGLLAMADS